MKCNSILLCSLPSILLSHAEKVSSGWLKSDWSLWLTAHNPCSLKGPHRCCCDTVQRLRQLTDDALWSDQEGKSWPSYICYHVQYLGLNIWTATWEENKEIRMGLSDTSWLWVTWFAKWCFQVSEWAQKQYRKRFFLKQIDNILSLI